MTPLGNPLALMATLPVKPPVRVMDMVLAPLAPRLTVMLDGLAERLKSGVGAGFTVMDTGAERVSPPPDPVAFTMKLPSVAVLDALTVIMVLFPVVDIGLNVTLNPAGSGVVPVPKETLPVKPPVLVIVMVLEALAIPRTTVKLVGFAVSEKSGVGGWLTVRLMVAVWHRAPLVPVIVMVAGPSVAVVDALKVTLLLVPVVDAGVKLAVTPAGSPVALSATLPVNPPVCVIVIVLLALAPRFTVTAEGLAESEKSGVGGDPPGDRKSVV